MWLAFLSYIWRNKMGLGYKNISSPQRATEVLGVRKTGGGTPVLSGLCANFCSIIDNGAGDYTILVNTKRPFGLGCIAVATPHSSGIIHLDVAGTDKLQVSVKCFEVDGVTPDELDFDLIVMGTHALDYQG